MPERMLKFVSVPQQMPSKRTAAERRTDFGEIYRSFAERRSGGAVQPLQPMRRAVLLDPLPAAQQHPRLAEADRRGPAGGSVRGQLGDQQLSRDLRPHLPAGPALRGQLRHREGVRERHDRRGREIHHRHGVREWLGASRSARGASWTGRSASSAPGPAGLAAAEQLRRRGYQVQVYDRYDRVGGLMIYGIPNFKLEKEVVLRRWKLFEESGIRFTLNCRIGEGISASPSCAPATTPC